jgi:AraC-like DNA-binding protein
VRARDVAEAHQKDLFHQEEYGCKCMTYWIDEERENVFCLIDAPDKNVVEAMHSRAHGLIPNKIIEVSSSLVESFLGRIYDPTEAAVSNDGLKVFSDPSFRILLVTKITDPVLLQQALGKEGSRALLQRHNDLIRKNGQAYGGREVEHSGEGFILSFASAGKAVDCALSIQNEMEEADRKQMDFRIGINAGEPVTKSDQLFGDTLEFAHKLCLVAGNGRIGLSWAVKELVSKDYLLHDKKMLTLAPPEENLLELLFSQLEENWQDPGFSMTDYCQGMTMSKSQLYRKTMEFFGLSPNLLLKEFRLQKAKELMKQQGSSISQVTFDSGFTSPSYFTKCFKKKYGLLPMAYLDLLH